jgi:hypothetical protein
METMDKPPERDESGPDTQEESRSGSGFRTRVRRFGPRGLIVAGLSLLVFLILLVVAVDAGLSSPALCATCHEMEPWVASWSVSPHAEVACYSCHGTPRPWYGAPLSVVERWASLGHDMSVHSSAGSIEVTGTGGGGAAPPVPDATCQQCHDPTRVVTSRFGVQIRHTEHAARNKSCVSCHRWTAHPYPGGNANLLLMKECFNCHSVAKGAKAPGACTACHLKGLDLRPDSHKTGEWKTRHGKVAVADRRQCAMCHRDDFCRGCHGVVMPHPQGWGKGRYSHAVVARHDTAVCARCHKGSTNLCTMCHHKGYDAKKGPWVAQHSNLASAKGVAFCFECHDALFCANCHSATPKPSGPP